MKTGNIVFDLLYYIYYMYLIYTSKNHHILHFRFIFPKNCKLIRTLGVGDGTPGIFGTKLNKNYKSCFKSISLTALFQLVQIISHNFRRPQLKFATL